MKNRLSAVLARDFGTPDGDNLLQAVADEGRIRLPEAGQGRKIQMAHTHRTLMQLKSFLSGIFKVAKRKGYLNGPNPMQDVSIPRGRESEETYCYSIDEVTRMLETLAEPLGAIVALIAFTGVRRSEFLGLRWEDYDGKTVCIRRSVVRKKWGPHEPKTRAQRAAIPVIRQLRRKLEAYRQASGNPQSGLMFRSMVGAKSDSGENNERRSSVDLGNAARRYIIPALRKRVDPVTGESDPIPWHGWHAFRRGLATPLRGLGVDDRIIQNILRHSSISVTHAHYIKEVPILTAAAMDKLDRVCSSVLNFAGQGKLAFGEVTAFQ